jgi:hypothetical protein
MPPTTEPLGRHCLDQTFVWILADDKERQSLPRTPAPGTCYGRSSNIPLRGRGICRATA